MYRGATRSLSLAVTSFRTYFLPNATTRKGIGTLRLLVFNTTVSGTLYAVGDVIQQKIFGTTDSPYDHTRTARMCALGLCMGPLNHFWYLQLDRLVIGEGMAVVLKKIICDQLMFAPTCITVFYLGKQFTICLLLLVVKITVCMHCYKYNAIIVGMSFLEGKKWTQSKRELQAKFLPSYKVSNLLYNL